MAVGGIHIEHTKLGNYVEHNLRYNQNYQGHIWHNTINPFWDIALENMTEAEKVTINKKIDEEKDKILQKFGRITQNQILTLENKVTASFIKDKHYQYFTLSTSLKNNPRGKKPSFEASMKEAIVNLEEHHDMKDLHKIKDFLENKFDFRVLQMSLHRDEGYLIDKKGNELSANIHYKIVDGIAYHLKTNPNGTFGILPPENERKMVDMSIYETKFHYHAHINFLTHTNGRQRWNFDKLGKAGLSELQTDISNILCMQRGQDKRISKNKHLQPLDYKLDRAGLFKNKELTNELSEIKMDLIDIDGLIDFGSLGVKNLKSKISLLREHMKGNGFRKEAYQILTKELGKINKSFIKSEIKDEEGAKEWIITLIQNLYQQRVDFDNQIANNTDIIKQKDKEIASLKSKISYLNQNIQELSQTSTSRQQTITSNITEMENIAKEAENRKINPEYAEIMVNMQIDKFIKSTIKTILTIAKVGNNADNFDMNEAMQEKNQINPLLENIKSSINMVAGSIFGYFACLKKKTNSIDLETIDNSQEISLDP